MGLIGLLIRKWPGLKMFKSPASDEKGTRGCGFIIPSICVIMAKSSHMLIWHFPSLASDDN